MTPVDYSKIITSERRSKSRISGRNLTEQLASDRSRILYSAPFKRLSKKAQVFSLENNAAIRNRVTHTLEVSDVGRWIAYQITQNLIKSNELNPELQLPFMYAVENACLLHDIGNPPFGHFGEAAVQKWFGDNWSDCYIKSRNFGELPPSDEINRLIKDFLEFDGNPQGLRIALRLQRDRDEFSLNLTYTTILSAIKYVRSPSEESDNNLRKKPGYFESEKDIIRDIKSIVGVPYHARYPMAYVMEAADDIAYCISDIEDGIEKNIITAEEFFQELNDEWSKVEGIEDDNTFPIGEIDQSEANADFRFFQFKTSYTRKAIQIATDKFLEHKDKLLSGTYLGIFSDSSVESSAIKCLKTVARRKLFRSPEAENPELAGYSIVTGLLDAFKPLLTCDRSDFNKLLDSRTTPNSVTGKGLDLQWRLFNKLPRKHIVAYEDQLKEFEGKDVPEWYFRAHLIIDYIAGMTDDFALELYQLLKGIRLK